MTDKPVTVDQAVLDTLVYECRRLRAQNDELLALARAVVGEPGEFDDAADWKDARMRLVQMAEAAIAKVKGEE